MAMTDEATVVRLVVRSAAAGAILASDDSGGHQEFHRWLHKKLGDSAGLASGDVEVALTDEELGRLVRHMGYGSGGFQSRLRKCFSQALVKHIHYI